MESVSKQAALRVIVLGAHPDDCEGYFGGTAALYASLGHKVTFVSLTNGDAGHHLRGGGDLARTRLDEAHAAKEILGIENYIILDYHDGELLPTIDLRKHIVRLIRRYGCDLVFTHRPYDYHPDHRYGSMAVQDAAYLVMVPNICPETPVLRRNPVFFYLQDAFRKPVPFQPDISVAVDTVWETKIRSMAAHACQFGEWLPWVDGYAHELPDDKAEAARQAAARYTFPIDAAVRGTLHGYYGEAAGQVERAESFEICEYGRQPAEGEIPALFPMLPSAISNQGSAERT